MANPLAAITLFIPDFASVRLIACSPPAWAALLALEEKRLRYDTRKLSFQDGEHRAPDMLARNPRGTIPVLTDGDGVVCEAVPILEYLDFAYPSPPLMPAEATARARALTRLHDSAHLRSTSSELFSWLMETPEAERSPERMEAMAGALHRELTFWERCYCQGGFAAGDALSLADLCVFAHLATVVRLGLDLPEWYPSLQRFHGAMLGRASVKATWPTTWAERLDVLS